MTRAARLDNKPDNRPSAMEDYRCWAQVATEFLMEIREHMLTLEQDQSNKLMLSRVEFFLEHNKLPPLSQ